jgi:hemophore-related protein
MKATKVIGSIIGSGAAAIAVLAGSGVASAAPNIEAIVYSTCSYPQVMAALNATSPEMAANFEASPMAVMWLQNLIASGPEQRREMIAQVQTLPGIQAYTTLINQVATSCQNF